MNRTTAALCLLSPLRIRAFAALLPLFICLSALLLLPARLPAEVAADENAATTNNVSIPTSTRLSTASSANAATATAPSASASPLTTALPAVTTTGLAATAASKPSFTRELLLEHLASVSRMGPAGYLLYILGYALACMLCLPASILTLGSGIVFGIWLGGILSSIGITLGALLPLLIGRYIARDWVRRRFAQQPRYAALERAMQREGWKIVLLSRLSPLFPHTLVAYALGTSSMPVRHFILATWLGCLPTTAVYVNLGAMAGTLSALGTPQAEKTPLEWALQIAGVLAALVVAWFVSRMATRALQQTLDSESKPAKPTSN